MKIETSRSNPFFAASVSVKTTHSGFSVVSHKQTCQARGLVDDRNASTRESGLEYTSAVWDGVYCWVP